MILKEIKILLDIIKSLSRKVVIIFLSIAFLQTISWYYTSRSFFRSNLVELFKSNENISLIEYFYWFISDFFTLLIIPVLIVKLILKEKLNNFGFQIGDYKAGLKYTSLFILFMIPIIWVVSGSQSFASTYPHLQSARSNWSVFILFETGMLIYMMAWEFIWRGYMLFGLKEKFGYYAIIIQMIPFLILHNGKPVLETFGAIFGGIALGILAWRTASFYYCVIIHTAVMFTIDFISILRFRSSDYGIGLNSILNIFKSFF
ncbi:MAG TPA: CPBP family intramembrane metalloprotease [Ignavibacteriaceae bacterium]|nr:CPBP family intramembrane metalloprotease [Ignavibacteriaceae bacterium]